MNNPRNELYNLCKILIDNSTDAFDYGITDHSLVKREDLVELEDCIERCDEYASSAHKSYVEWCKERGQWP